MTNWKLKAEEVEKFIDDWKEGILKNCKNRDLIVSNNIHGSFNSPSQKYKFYRAGGFAFHKDIFKKKEDIKPFMEAIPFVFFFVKQDIIDFESE